MDPTVFAVFAFVYAGMITGHIPPYAIDRTGIALLGAIFLVADGKIALPDAWAAIDPSTVALLLGLMVVSAQFRLAGFYTRVTRALAASGGGPERLLALVIGAAALLSALLVNDIVCLAMTPILIEGCARRRLNPMPFLLALACAANIGSAATLIGNPQNMLIGEKLKLSFAGYLRDALPPVLAGLAACWWIIARAYRGRFDHDMPPPDIAAPPFCRWQTVKGLLLLGALVALFVAPPLPRDILALAAAGILLLSRRMATRDMLGLVDWQLLVLFASLFVVNGCLESTGGTAWLFDRIRASGVDLDAPAPLFVASTLLSNLVSNVPAVMLLLPASTHPAAGAVLALSSTLAGNLFLVGSIANLIVVESARRHGIAITWADHARVGVPVTLATLAIAALWLVAVGAR